MKIEEMFYVNQLEYAHIPYPTDIEHSQSEYACFGTVRTAGCGLCAVCMVTGCLTGQMLPLETCRDLSVLIGANRQIGTDMTILGKAVAERFQLHMTTTNDTAEMAASLHQGGVAIANVSGDRENYHGIFSNIGHYIVVTGEAEGFFQIYDPSWTPEKYSYSARCNKAYQDGKTVWATADVLREETSGKNPAFYLFFRKCSEKGS